MSRENSVYRSNSECCYFEMNTRASMCLLRFVLLVSVGRFRVAASRALAK